MCLVQRIELKLCVHQTTYNQLGQFCSALGESFGISISTVTVLFIRTREHILSNNWGFDSFTRRRDKYLVFLTAVV